MKNLIFMGGIHGVGKTTFCNELSNRYPLSSFSASRIISDIKKQKFTSNKQITDIDKNQDFLIQGIEQIESASIINIIDGHFCLIDKKNNISRIPKEIFTKLEPILLIVVIDSVNKIIDRLQTRDKLVYSPLFIESFQNEEIKYAKMIAEMLGKPLFIFNNTPESKLELHEFITELGVI
ncbi:ATP-binding protein [Paenibacillus puerhi]|uniref:ATP-binding protein n=1 Tax=Paenibacillus puerhi TaxID=2692622 RepID=UPI00135A1537|nr:ATP-binding protein [Paenibacillus puerhi]